MVYSQSERRTLLITAVAFFAFVVAAEILALPGSPPKDASPQRIQSYYEAHTTAIGVAAWILTLGFVPLLLFLSQLSAIVRRSGEDARPLATALLGGGVAGIALLGASNAATIAAVFRVAYDTTPLGAAGAQALWDLQGSLGVLSAVPMAVVLFAVAAASFRHAVMPSWIAVAGVIIGVALLVPYISPWVYGLFVIWVLAAGFSMSRRAEGTSRVTGRRPTPTPA
jgi:hypothetical protein